jgi:HK97 family phage major capsid protein
MSDVLKSIEEIGKQIEGYKSETEQKMKTELEAVKSQFSVVKDEADKLKEEFTEMKKVNGRLKLAEEKSQNFGSMFKKEVENNFDRIKDGQPFKMDIKAVGDMTMSAHLLPGGANDAIPTIQSGIVTKPGQLLDFADMVQTVESSTGLYWIYKETVGEGGIGAKAHGANSSQIDYEVTKEVNNIGTIAGHAVIDEEFLQDLSYLQQVLPQMLMRDFRKVQNTIFSTALFNASTLDAGAATQDVEQLIDAISAQEELDYNVNGIVMRPANFARLYKTVTTGGGYNLPNVVSVAPNGGVLVEGIPTAKATWGGLTANFGLMGDWSNAKIVQASPITISFFDRDFTLAKAGKVGIKISARQAVAIDRTAAFRRVNLGVA